MKYRIYWGWDGSTEGADIIEAEDVAEAMDEAHIQMDQMCRERAFYRAEPVDSEDAR